MKNEINEEVSNKVSGGAYYGDLTNSSPLEEWYYRNEVEINKRVEEAGATEEYIVFYKTLLKSPDKLNTFKSIESFKKYIKEKFGVDCDNIV